MFLPVVRLPRRIDRTPTTPISALAHPPPAAPEALLTCRWVVLSSAGGPERVEARWTFEPAAIECADEPKPAQHRRGRQLPPSASIRVA